MTEHDLLGVVEVEETCGLSRWGWEGYHAELCGKDAIMFVAAGTTANPRLANQVLGFIAARVIADELHINNIAVHQMARRTGIGGALLTAAYAAAARRAAVQSAVLEVRVANVAAQAFYARYGFQVVGRRCNYYTDPVEDALVMRAPLKAALCCSGHLV